MLEAAEDFIFRPKPFVSRFRGNVNCLLLLFPLISHVVLFKLLTSPCNTAKLNRGVTALCALIMQSLVAQRVILSTPAPAVGGSMPLLENTLAGLILNYSNLFYS